MKITPETYVSEILKEYGDIAETMELFGIKSVGGYKFRRIITRLITVKTAAFIHRVPTAAFIDLIETAIQAGQKPK